MGKKWSEKEIDLLRSKNKKEELMKLLPERTWLSIKAKRNRIGLGCKDVKVWSKEEIEILKTCKTFNESRMFLQYRTEESIRSKRVRLGLTKKRIRLKIT